MNYIARLSPAFFLGGTVIAVGIKMFLERSRVREVSEEEEEPEVILVNIWNQVNGKLLLREKKPFSKKEFEQMEKMKDFSGLFSSQGGSHQVVQVKYKERADK